MLNTPNEIHVSITGHDKSVGTASAPLRTISAAAETARSGDTVIVHEGVYREEVNPPRGGISDKQRITYQAAEGECVEIRGSEVVTGWTKAEGSIWTTTLDNALFGNFNPFADLIQGDWFKDMGRNHHTGCVYLNGKSLVESASLDQLQPNQWYAEVDDSKTVVWAHFGDSDPNEGITEVNVRQTVFYPRQTGIDYLTVRGFHLRHAATPWAPPTAEQIALIGTHWSKGWIIEDNIISDSRCAGLSLGKYGDQYDNTSADTAEGYVETVKRALENNWNRDHIGSHLVQNNVISHCDQAGIVGSLGAIYSKIIGNTIHDIHLIRHFDGAEQAGLKLHAPINTLIADNHIYRCCRGIWMDWMTQGTRITRNLCHDNEQREDLFVEVNHGPFVVDHNIFLSPVSLATWSQGGAYLHNLFGGKLVGVVEENRETPYHPFDSTEIAGISKITGGDDRFLNNLIVDHAGFNALLENKWQARTENDKGPSNKWLEVFPTIAANNTFLQNRPALIQRGGSYLLNIDLKALKIETVPAVSGNKLGETKTSSLPFLDYDGKVLLIDSDYFLEPRDQEQTLPGPFASYVSNPDLSMES